MTQNPHSKTGARPRGHQGPKQSYGLRDFKYLKLKIMDLPSRKIRVSI